MIDSMAVTLFSQLEDLGSSLELNKNNAMTDRACLSPGGGIVTSTTFPDLIAEFATLSDSQAFHKLKRTTSECLFTF